MFLTQPSTAVLKTVMVLATEDASGNIIFHSRMAEAGCALADFRHRPVGQVKPQSEPA